MNRQTIGLALFGFVLTVLSAFYIDAAPTKAIDHAFDDDPDRLRVRDEKSLFHSIVITSGGRHNHA